MSIQRIHRHLRKIFFRIHSFSIFFQLKIDVTAFGCIIFCRLTDISQHLTSFRRIPFCKIQFLQLSVNRSISVTQILYHRTSGFFIFLNIQFIKGIPMDLDEAARMDGCSTYTIFFRIILSLIKPSLVTSAIFSFMWRWDDFLAALLYLSDPLKYPVSYALKMFSDPTAGSDWGAMFAMATLSLIPIFVIFLTMQKYLVEGIASTGIKG